MGGSSKKQTVGYKYYLGLHMVLSHGPIDKITGIYGDEKLAWSGVWSNGQINVNAQNLFGGEEKEGGLSGTFDLAPGYPTQAPNGYLTSKLAPELVPSYRGVASVILHQAYVGTQAYLKKLGFMASRIHVRTIDGLTQWYDEKAEVLGLSSPFVLLSEDFTNGDADYTITGTNTFSIAPGDYGQTLTFYGGSTTQSIAARSTPEGFFVGASLKFRLNQKKSDDNGIIAFFDSSNALVFSFIIAREAAFDTLQRPSLGFVAGSSATTQIGTAAVTVGVWYQLDTNYNSTTGKFDYTVKTISSGAVHGSGSVNISIGHKINRMQFMTDGGTNSGNVSFANIIISSVNASPDMNPAHIIRECLTDPDWGMGYQESDIDNDSFTEAADMLFGEGFGISILWNRQTAIEDFIKEIIKHIDGTLYVDRKTGTFKLKLIRDDFEEDDLITLDESNIDKITDFTRPSFGELTNSITVQFWDRELVDDSSVTVQDIALAQMQGTTINTTQQYNGVTNKLLAARIAQRDLKTVSTPIASCTIYANRDAAGLDIGSPFKLTWPDYKCDELVMRVTSIAYGDGKSNRVRLTCTQDVYKLPNTAIIIPETPAWTDPNAAPQPATLRLPYEVPYLEAVQQQGQAAVDSALTSDPTISFAAISVGRPGSAINASMFVNSGAGFENEATIDFCPTAKLVAAISYADTTFDVTDAIEIESAPDGTWFQMDDEIMVKVSYASPTLTVKRGALDTVPAIHAAGAMLYFWDAFATADSTQYNEGETVQIKVCPITGQGELALASAPTNSLEFQGRLARPYPPGNLKINGAYYPASSENTLALTWAHRDRKAQTGASIVGFLDGNIGPEVGTTYRARLLNAADDSLIVEQVGVTGTSAELSTTYSGAAIVELYSIRDSLNSYQRQRVPIYILSDDTILTESDGPLLLENLEAFLLDDSVPSAAVFFNIQNAADIRDGNRQTVFFYWGGYGAGWAPTWPCTFTIHVRRRGLTEGATDLWSFDAVCTGVSVAPLSPTQVDQGMTTGGVGSGSSDQGLNGAANDADVDLYCMERSVPGATYPDDWCQDFNTIGEGALSHWAIAFPKGVRVHWRTNLGLPYYETGLGEIEFYASSVSSNMGSSDPTSERAYYDARTAFNCSFGTNFEDEVTVARPQITRVRFDGDVLVDNRYQITLNSTVFSYTAKIGDTEEDIINTLQAMIDADANYTATVETSGPDFYVQITGAPAVGFTVNAAVLPTADTQRVFFWYDAATSTTVFADMVLNYGALAGGMSDVGPLLRFAPADKWIAGITELLLTYVPPVYWVQGADDARAMVTPQPDFGTGQFLSAIAYDTANDKFFAMSYSNDGATTREHVLNLDGTIVSSTTVTVGGSSSYQFYPWQLLKFGTKWHSFEANSGTTSHFTRDVSASNWTEDNTDWYGTTSPSYAKQAIAADTLSSGSILVVAVDFVDTSASPQAHYLRFLTSTDGTTFTVQDTVLLNSADGLGATSGTIGWVVTAGGGFGSMFMRVGTKLAYYFYSTTTGGTGTGPGMYVIKSNDDGTTWTTSKCTIDGINSDKMLTNIIGTADGSHVVARYATNMGFGDAACFMAKTTDGIAFTTIANADLYAPGFADQPGDYLPVPGNIDGDLKGPILASGSRILFERKLRQ